MAWPQTQIAQPRAKRSIKAQALIYGTSERLEPYGMYLPYAFGLQICRSG